MELDLSKLDEIVPQELAIKIRKSMDVIKQAFEKYRYFFSDDLTESW